ncbi:hypothetical protein [Cupriavidus sp. 2SB]|uniref:hypothetical protein n=1 Tax=Cupriavidus sp. 2SB TaxID=2502199 RepID=UPI0010F59283|nr:hypothetical protein [Cupriavidus sp. 2SB]
MGHDEAGIREYRTRIRAAAVAWREDHRSQHDVWTIETVKHLAFVNGAGLAGAAALYASTDAAKKVSGLLGVPAAVFFAVGLALAVLDMYFNSLGALSRMKDLDARLRIWDNHPGPGEPEAKKLLKDTAAGKWCFIGAEFSGWLSAILFVFGAYPFVFLKF